MDRLEVARFASMPEAELMVGLLRRHGIDAVLADRDMAYAAPHLQFALGGLRVTAPDDQIAEARALVRSARAGDLQAEDDDGWMEDHTPGRVGELHDHEITGALGSSSMKTIGKIVILSLLALPVLSVGSCMVAGVMKAWS